MMIISNSLDHNETPCDTSHCVPCCLKIKQEHRRVGANARLFLRPNQRTEGPESCQDKFLADALLNEAYMSK